MFLLYSTDRSWTTTDKIYINSTYIVTKNDYICLINCKLEKQDIDNHEINIIE